MSDKIEAMKDKIAKLLAKAEGTDNPDEAKTYSEAAERLMLKWGIEAAELEAAGEIKPEEIVTRSVVFTGDYARTWLEFATAAAQGFGALGPMVAKSRASSAMTFYVVGHETDVTLFLQLLHSLQLQAMTAVRKWWRTAPEREWLTPWEGYQSRRSFLLEYGYVVAARLSEIRRSTQQEASTGAALVLVDKAAKVQNHMDGLGLKAGKERGLDHGFSGRAAGAQAGREADIGQTTLANERKALGR